MLLGLALGLVAGIAIVMAGPVVAGLVGAVGVIISVINFFTLTADEELNFSAARLLGVLAGIALAVILGGYTLISLPLLFVLGLSWLVITVVRLLVLEVVSEIQIDNPGRPIKLLA